MNKPELLPTSSTIALTTGRDLRQVTGPENLPPSVAREVAVIVSTYQMTGADFARDLIKLGGMTAVFVLVALTFLGTASAIGAVIGFGMALPMIWRQAPLKRAQQHLKELGIGWGARRRLNTRLAAIVGNLPARHPADRPGVDEVVALLAPGGVDPWSPAATVSAQPVLVTDAGVDVALARSVVAHTLDRQERERRLVGISVFLGVGMGAFLSTRGVPLPPALIAMMVVVVVGSFGVGLALGRVISRNLLGRMLSSLGVARGEQDRVIAALKPLLRRKALSKIPADKRRDVLTARLVEALSSPSLPPSSLT